MKNVAMFVGAAVAAAMVAGCKTAQTPESVDTLSRLIGATTGQVVMMSKLDAQQHNAIYDIVVAVKDITPSTNETYQAAVNRIAEPIVDKYIADGKLQADAKPLIMSGANTVGLGIDYLFKRHPAWKNDEVLVKTAIHGFCDGFLAVVKPANTDSLSAGLVDVECYEYLKAAQKK